MEQVKPSYLHTQYEFRQMQQIEQLFAKFDENGNGSLDAQELRQLYLANDI